MLSRFLKAFTLVEMLVALAVSSIIIAASYASYEMVATQYKKNMDIADMHTSGRAIMRIIERDIRMAGFEYRDTDAKITYGSISNPLTIKDSGNKCCDEVTVIYDYYDEESKKAERIRIRYWAGSHTSNKGSRHRLYKQKDILGQNKKILAKPKLGNKEVMADYIEDLQIVNIVNNMSIYTGYYGDRGIDIYDPQTKQRLGMINSRTRTSALAFGPNGLLYTGYYGDRGIDIYDPQTKQRLGMINSRDRTSALAFGPNGLLYTGYYGDRGIDIYDPQTKQRLGMINSRTRTSALAFLNSKIGQESLVTINLTLRTKNQYGKDRQFKKKDYHGGNFKIDITDKYKRDTFSSTVLVRNLAL
jgi:prepilin-type N-terminal cleavage/methylation domain-containing protein